MVKNVKNGQHFFAFRILGVEIWPKNDKKGFTKLWLKWRGLTILGNGLHTSPIIFDPKISIFGPRAKIFFEICRLPPFWGPEFRAK